MHSADLHQQWTPQRAAAFQLAPGVANLVAFVPFAWWFGQIGLPPFLALGVAILVAEIPVSWWLMVRETRRESGTFSVRAAFPWLRPIPLWQYLVIGLPMIAISIAIIAGLGPIVSGGIRDALPLNVPSWFLLEPDPEAFAQLSQPVLVSMWLTMLLIFAGVGGVTQELYARGFLLPRTAHWGPWAPAFNALLFGVFHLGSPWSWPVFALLALPWAYAVWWKRSAKIGLFAHVGMLLMQSLMFSLLVFGLVSFEQLAG